VLDELCVWLFVKYQVVVDIQEALQCDNMLEKENIHNASQFLAPNPQPLPCTSETICNPLSAISHEVPALVNNEVSPKPLVGTKKQHLTLYDTNEVMVLFAASNQQSELSFQEMKCKTEAEKEKGAIEKFHFLMFLIEKKASGAISNEEFELFKNI